MTYFVHYDYGYCNNGSHEVGIEKFDSLDQVKKFIDKLNLKHKNSPVDCIISVIYGEEVDL